MNHRILASLACVLAPYLAGPATARTVYDFILEESQEVPPTGSDAIGGCIAALATDESSLTVTCVHDVENVTAAHIHNAPPGMNGGIVFPFPESTSPFAGVWPLSEADVALLEAGNLYVNVHSTDFPNGEIRGQIFAPSNEPYRAQMDGSQMVPPTGSKATGSCDGAFPAVEPELFLIACTHDVTDPNRAVILNAPPGQVGTPVALIPFASPILGGFVPTADQLVELRAGRLYLRIDSETFEFGEIRGQILPSSGVIFEDGFESGDTTAWDASVE